MVVYMAELGWRVHPLRQNILYTTFGKANRETTSSKTIVLFQSFQSHISMGLMALATSRLYTDRIIHGVTLSPPAEVGVPDVEVYTKPSERSDKVAGGWFR